MFGNKKLRRELADLKMELARIANQVTTVERMVSMASDLAARAHQIASPALKGVQTILGEADAKKADAPGRSFS